MTKGNGVRRERNAGGAAMLALAFVLAAGGAPAQEQQAPAEATEAAEPAPETAPAPRGPFAGFKHDSTAPIEVTSAALEVRQDEQLAIFTGDVVAGQGSLRLTADKITVSYNGDENGDSTGQITQMIAEGDVLLSNGAETAEGARAEYDVTEGVVRMSGDVLLTQGQNAISGQSLVIDLAAGTGRVEAGAGERVRSVFTPSPQ